LYSFFDKRLAVQHIGVPKGMNVEAPAQTLTDTDAIEGDIRCTKARFALDRFFHHFI
jgi:hypothetical protein